MFFEASAVDKNLLKLTEDNALKQLHRQLLRRQGEQQMYAQLLLTFVSFSMFNLPYLFLI